MMPSRPVISVASLVSDNPDVRADAVSQLGHECREKQYELEVARKDIGDALEHIRPHEA